MSKNNSNLATYKSKRDLKRSPEPPAQKGKKKYKKRIFVIQKHDARAHHYDFRIEVHGVLKSWAVPKGPSTDPRVKHLAVKTEDHPYGYAQFEGVIPEGHYGAGPVMIWDKGTYVPIKDSAIADDIKEGHVEIFLHGHKIKGGYALIRMGLPTSKNWLLIKMKDEYADARRKPTKTQNRSVVSNRTIKQIEKGDE